MCHISSADRLDLIHPPLVFRRSGDKTVTQEPQGALSDREEELFLVAEIHIDQGARQTGGTRHLVNRQRIPTLLCI
jgi:hypothetical protein